MRHPPLESRKPAQKVSLIFAYICYGIGCITLIIAGYQGTMLGTNNPVFASLAASVVFFIGCGIVLHVMGVVSLPDFKINKK